MREENVLGEEVELGGIANLPDVPKDGDEPTKESEESEKTSPIEYALEVYGHLLGRVDAFLRRLATWDESKLGSLRGDFVKQVAAAKHEFEMVGNTLIALKVSGAPIKRTHKSRILGAIAMGDDIALGDGLRKLYGAYYSASEMDHVTVVGYDDKTVFVIPGDRDGAVPIPAKYSGLVVK